VAWLDPVCKNHWLQRIHSFDKDDRNSILAGLRVYFAYIVSLPVLLIVGVIDSRGEDLNPF
jgi:hypothetical protein